MSPGIGPDLISLYNLYPSATVVGRPNGDFSTGQAMDAMEQIARDQLSSLFLSPLLPGAGANARKSIGITVLSGMLASTCLAVLFVPAFYVFLQRLSGRGNGLRDSRQPGE